MRAFIERLTDGGLMVWYGGPWAKDPGDWSETKHCTYWLWRHRLAGWFACPLKGCDFYPDMCMRPEHDICARCNDVRGGR